MKRQPRVLVRPVECYFDRAIRFAPTDTVVRVLYSRSFWGKKNRTVEAIGATAAINFAMTMGHTST
jgi:hypothetical protein